MTPLRSALLLLALCATHVATARAAPRHDELPPDATQRIAYEHAAAAFRAQRYPAAYGLFTRLADAGHAPSARLALVMFDHGRTLFERDWYASPDQQRRWNALVANGARGRVMVDAAAGD